MPDAVVVLGNQSEHPHPLRVHILVGRNRQQTYKKITVLQMVLRVTEKNKTGKGVGSGGSGWVGRKAFTEKGCFIERVRE